jgi:serine/threonine-protein kinase
MGVVYLAEPDGGGDALALKVLVRRLAARSVVERFRREVRVAARLRHPNVLPVLDSGGDDDLLWFTMPYVAGGSLRERLSREGPLPIADALRLTCDVARALQHAHDRGIVHRDVKPENVLLTPEGGGLLADFGISRRVHSWAVDFEAEEEPLTQAGMRLGTPAYMSPEQACGDRVDQRSDVYSLGCVLHELLVGRAPFEGGSARELFARQLEGAAPSVRAARPEVPAAVDEALRSALHRDPLARYWSAAGFARALEAALDGAR